MEASLDGTGVNLQKSRVLSAPFTMELLNDNSLGIPAGCTRAVSDGNWVFLKPLSPGSHELHSSGGSPDFTTDFH
jgi:hypothetical protein